MALLFGRRSLQESLTHALFPFIINDFLFSSTSVLENGILYGYRNGKKLGIGNISFQNSLNDPNKNEICENKVQYTLNMLLLLLLLQ